MEHSIEAIRAQRRNLLSLDDLKALLPPVDYPALCKQIAALVDTQVIAPVGSPNNTNGLTPALQMKYRVLRPKEDEGSRSNIMLLSPRLNISGYVHNIPLYRKHREILQPLSDYVTLHADELAQDMSRNERAYAIWRNEKMLDNPLCRSVVQYNGLREILRYYQTPEPFFDYLCDGAASRTVLIVENKDIWYTLRRLLLKAPQKRRLFGLWLDGIIYGEGKKAARKCAIQEYSAISLAPSARIFYFGDLDYEGIAIYLAVREANPELEIQLFSPAYDALLSVAPLECSKCHRVQQRPEKIGTFLSCFPWETAARIDTLLCRGEYIPQEALNAIYLTEAMRE